MVLSRRPDVTELLLVGPWSSAGTISCGPGGEVLWIRFKIGVYMPHLLTLKLRDAETPLPAASDHKFWLKGKAWQFPHYENTDTFIQCLVRDGLLTVDPLVSAVIEGHQPDIAPRTLRHRFLHTTGMSQKRLRHMMRAQRAAVMLQSGVSILETVFELGYYDQAHLTNALRQFVGRTPGQIIRERSTT
jgi:hypothetical protein